MKIKTILTLNAALNSLVGKNRVIESADGKSTSSVFEYYAFPTQTKLNIIRNLKAFKSALEVVEDFKKALVERLAPVGGTGEVDNSPELLVKFHAEMNSLYDSNHKVTGLSIIPWSVLDSAKIPAAVISELGILVKDMPTVATEDLVSEDLLDNA